MSQRLPVFPLGTVLFPGLVLPLHIFEDRYRELVRHLMARPEETAREFGVVAIRQGWEVLPVSGSTGTAAPMAVRLHDIGCTAQLRQVTELPNGRFDIVTVGRRRFRITDLESDTASYFTATVEWLPEPSGQEKLAELLAPRVLAVFRQYLDLVRTDSEEINEQLPDNPRVLSHLVAATTALTLSERQQLLAEADTARRLGAELRLLSREAALLRQVRAVPVPLPDLAVPASPN